LGTKLGCCFAATQAPRRHKGIFACAWRVRWLQDVASSKEKVKTDSFNSVSEGALGSFGGFHCSLFCERNYN